MWVEGGTQYGIALGKSVHAGVVWRAPTYWTAAHGVSTNMSTTATPQRKTRGVAPPWPPNRSRRASTPLGTIIPAISSSPISIPMLQCHAHTPHLRTYFHPKHRIASPSYPHTATPRAATHAPTSRTAAAWGCTTGCPAPGTAAPRRAAAPTAVHQQHLRYPRRLGRRSPAPRKRRS